MPFLTLIRFLALLSGGTTFTKFDLQRAFYQLTLDEHYQKLVAENTD